MFRGISICIIFKPYASTRELTFPSGPQPPRHRSYLLFLFLSCPDLVSGCFALLSFFVSDHQHACPWTSTSGINVGQLWDLAFGHLASESGCRSQIYSIWLTSETGYASSSSKVSEYGGSGISRCSQPHAPSTPLAGPTFWVMPPFLHMSLPLIIADSPRRFDLASDPRTWISAMVLANALPPFLHAPPFPPSQ